MPYPPSAACRFFDLPPVNLQNLPLHLTKNSFASAPTHLCGIALTKRFRLCGGEAVAFRSPPPPLRCDYPATMWWPTLAGRGGSVSRRDHSPKTEKRAQAARARKSAGKAKLIPSYSSGGSAREELLLEKLPPSHTLTRPPSHSSGGSAREGLLLEKPPPSHTPHVLTSSVEHLWGLACWLCVRETSRK